MNEKLAELIENEKARQLKAKESLSDSPISLQNWFSGSRAYVRGFADGAGWFDEEDDEAIEEFHMWSEELQNK